MVVVKSRSTVPAEMYFSEHAVVDGRLRTEFFKHLPGIFTGIGIIGTFSGLIKGLEAFKVSENAAIVRAGLESLMHTVGEAFIISGAAIFFAMLVTLLEKLLLAALYEQTEDIVRAIDAHFESGAGEEYLSRLVKASEDSASQAKILKDALVKDMSQLLRELTASQIAAAKEQQEALASRLDSTAKEQAELARQDNQALGGTIADSIRQSLEGPMKDIAETVKAASGDQSSNASRMLQVVMSSFSQRLNDLFGGQISGLSDLNQQTARSMQDAVTTLQTLVSNIEDSSRRSTDTMAERMADAIEKMEARQESINATSSEFIDQIRQLVSTSQTETSNKLQSTLETMGSQVETMLGKLNDSQKQVFDSNQVREQAMSDRSSQVVSAMSESVESVVMELNAAISEIARSVSSLTQVTSTSVEKMYAGAEKLGSASRDFASAGDRVSGVMGQAATVSAKFSETSGALTSGASAIQELLRDYSSQRAAVATLVTELRTTVESARREASLTSDILARIEGSAQKLGTAQKQADEYLAGVSEVLGNAHTTFATEVKRTLDKANNEFHTKLSSAVGLLSSAVSELEVTLASMGTMAPVRKSA
nr:anti-phage ZorAB system protein ZorA [Massilia aquatica]